MTDDPDSVDELISRYLDGEATDAEIVRVESDPTLMARAESMRAATEAVAAPVEIPTLDLDRIRAVAIASSATSDQVTDLAAASARRKTLERRNRFMAVAAAFVFLALGVAALQAVGTGDDDSSDTATEESSADATDTSESDEASDFSVAGDFDDMVEEEADDDMAEEEAEMAEEEAEDDVAEEDDMAEEDAPEEFAETGATDEAATTNDDPVAAPGRLDLLPDVLAPVDSVAALLDVIDATYSGSIDVEGGVGVARSELLVGLCDEAVAALDENQLDGTVSVELVEVVVDGEALTAIVAAAPDGSILVLTHPTGECAAVTVAG